MKNIICVWGIFLSVVSSVLASSDQAQTSVQVPVITIQDSINVGVREQIRRALKKNTAPAYIIKLDTPGGYLEVTREIVQDFMATEKPIIVWVSPEGARAASAGSMITMAAHYAAMTPTASIGAATPVSGDGKDIQEDMKDKVTNDTISFVEGIAEKRGRNKDWAKKSVSEAASITSQKAVQLGVIDAIHSDLPKLWAGARTKFPDLPAEVQFVDFEINLKERTLSFISNPNVAYGLMALGTLGIYVEFNHPGLIIPGTIGVISLALGAVTMQIVPIQPTAFILLIVGLALLIIEIFTPLPTFGMAGVFALLCFFLSGVFLMDSEQTNLTLDPAIWLPVFASICVLVSLLGWMTLKALQAKPVQQGLEALIGKEVEVVKVAESGLLTVKIYGELWKAQLAKNDLKAEPGQRLWVNKQDGLTLFVSDTP